MQVVYSALEFLQTYINFSDPKFIETLGYSFLCFFMWVFLPHLEFKYKLLSRMTGNDQGKAADFLAYFLIYSGTLRNHIFNEAVGSNFKLPSYGLYEIPVQILCYLSMAFGMTLIAFSFYRLGMRNMYFGDHFGFLFTEKITSFPYNYFDNPQYLGTTFLFLGYSISWHSPAGIFLTLVINVLYRILNVVEERKLKVFYPDSVNKAEKAE